MIGLTKKELQTIQSLGEAIKKEVDAPYTIDMLTAETGIPAAKLQIGFKHIYERTVTDYIKNVRLDVAEELIRTSELTISEVVYTIGFSSRSYFSKIFKERFGCSPKDFQDQCKQLVISA